jgi:hypothetical protein
VLASVPPTSSGVPLPPEPPWFLMALLVTVPAAAAIVGMAMAGAGDRPRSFRAAFEGVPVPAGKRRVLAERWGRLRAQYLEDARARSDLDVRLSVRYGRIAWAPRAEQKKFAQIGARMDRTGAKMMQILDTVSPRNWHHGAPSRWVYGELTWDDAIRPLDEPLSVTPPLPYGATHPMR